MDQVARNDRSIQRFVSLAWCGVALYILVILWGALVRMTGSGAGCRDAWPTCNNALIPDFEDFETVIEYVHRVTSGLALLMGAVIYGWSRKLFTPETAIRRFAKFALICLIIEALVGAVLVKLHLVKLDDSALRVVVIALHLANTLVLLGFATLCAVLASKPGGARIQSIGKPNREGALLLASVIVTGMFGAITALADTLNKMNVQGSEGQVLDPEHFLHSIKWAHPAIAMVTAGILVVIAHRTWVGSRPGSSDSRWSLAVIILVALQIVLGLANIQFVIPYWLQLAHLFIADLLWVSLLILMVNPVPESRFLES